MRRKFLVVAAAAALFATTAPPAHAGLWSGACAVRITMQFRAPVRPLDSVAYDLTLAGMQDLDLTKAGTQSCITTLTGEVTGGTWAGGSGIASVWSCGAAVAQGTWHQSFDPEGPDGFSGTHVLTGSWGAWTLSVANTTLNVLGVGEMTLQAMEATKTPSCAVGTLQSVTMVGTLVFQDP